MSAQGHHEAMNAPICCHGNCNQGKTCPTRQACELPVDDDLTDPATAVVTVIVAAIAILAMLCAVLPVL